MRKVKFLSFKVLDTDVSYIYRTLRGYFRFQISVVTYYLRTNTTIKWEYLPRFELETSQAEK